MESDVIRGRCEGSCEIYLMAFVCEDGRWMKLFRIIQSPVSEVLSKRPNK
jgi:hypothetical protein